MIEVCNATQHMSDLFGWRYAGIPAWREVSNHFREYLERSFWDFKELFITIRSKEIIRTIFKQRF